MIDRLIRRYASKALAVPAAGIASRGVHAQWLALAVVALGFAAVPAVSHSDYKTALALILVSRLLDLLAVAVAVHVPRTAREGVLSGILEQIWTAAIPFGFALAEPERALAAMFLMLGLIARASGLPPETGPIPAGSDRATDLGRDLVGAAELSVVYALLCLLPHWFSIVAYTLGITCFVMAGIRVARFEARRT